MRRLLMLAAAVTALALSACDPSPDPPPDEPAAPDDGVPTDENTVQAEPATPLPSPLPEDPDDADDPDENDATPAIDDPDLDAVTLDLVQVAVADAPTAGVTGPDGRLWIAERGGRVRVLGDDSLGEAVIDLSSETTTDGERGLLGLAFDPEFDHLYLSYTNPAGDTRVDEVALVDGRPDPDSRRTVLGVEQPFSNHNGGDIAFGPDGMLYVGLGDGGGGGDPLEAGQDLGTLLGKLLRIDPRGGDPYAVPADNPFVAEPEARDEIWAYGLRNPWRFSFDAATGDLWIADVGQFDREEVNWMPAGQGAGANYGWNLMEGTLPFTGPEPEDHVPPVFEYETTRARCAITGGYVYRGEAIPGLRGAYLYSDYCEGAVRALDVRDGEVVAEADFGVSGGQVVSFAQGPQGELYVLDLGGGVFRIGQR